jgi:hypothetical protein
MFNSNASSADAGGANYIEDVFSTWLYTGNGATQTITNGIDLSGKGGLTWIKDRSQAYGNRLFDTARGATKVLESEGSNAEGTLANGLTAFTSTGFSLGSYITVNTNADKFVSWTFREQSKFFDIVTWTGDGAGSRSINHNLQSAPGCIIMKAVNSSGNWFVWHIGNGGGVGSASPNVFGLNSTNAAQYINSYGTMGDSTIFYPTSPGADFNLNGVTYVAYLFAHNAGGFGLTGTDNVISCGSYVKDGSGNATVTLGYEPQLIIAKPISTSGRWYMYDDMRGMSMTYGALLSANVANAESSYLYFNPTATGFNDVSAADPGETYIYIAIRRGPMKVPTDGTKVFAINTRNGSGTAPPMYNSGYPIDMAFQREVTSSGDSLLASRLTSGSFMRTPTSDAETSNAAFDFDFQNGWYSGTETNPNAYSWMFKRAPGYFDSVCYTGTGSDASIAHNLTVVPELAIVKKRSGAAGWVVGCPLLSNTAYGFWNDAAPFTTSGGNANFQNVAWSDQFLYLRTDGDVNDSGTTYVAYLFATCLGVSKVGSYTGTATTQQINCGFAGGARFVMIKRTDDTGDWYMWDSARGIVAGNDPYILINSSAAQVTSTDYVDTYSAGFELTSTAPAALNASGGTYIFLAIA